MYNRNAGLMQIQSRSSFFMISHFSNVSLSLGPMRSHIYSALLPGHPIRACRRRYNTIHATRAGFNSNLSSRLIHMCIVCIHCAERRSVVMLTQRFLRLRIVLISAKYWRRHCYADRPRDLYTHTYWSRLSLVPAPTQTIANFKSTHQRARKHHMYIVFEAHTHAACKVRAHKRSYQHIAYTYTAATHERANGMRVLTCERVCERGRFTW